MKWTAVPADTAGQYRLINENGKPYRERRRVITWVDPVGAEVQARQLEMPRRRRPHGATATPVGGRTERSRCRT